MKRIALTIGLLALTGCTQNSRSPDAIRQDTANATATATRDAKAVAQGVFDGLKQKGPVNINRATKPQLETLPGIDNALADRIIAGRPYNTSLELRRRDILNKAEYSRIADNIKTH